MAIKNPAPVLLRHWKSIRIIDAIKIKHIVKKLEGIFHLRIFDYK